ncbi:DNA-invertase [Alteripontixanthobacter maritimus]|uniref:DNA-invertase n=1 Tax=Alteripontixanthobacter maritimus TaxID=2161824 RepID=A0A369Q3P6_9SPHN|nr:recombinase family protein [Alteripontixanthobacter maritimus]RDC59080.1 DNA-invertase [Alteripontixanthobacter maritimus]
MILETTKRCAIYTRKSSEEGLEQSFNSLDAQREACESYVLSQASERWEALPNRYDDGGFSGGNTTRPGLKALLDDIEAGRVDVVVVYKIDRLTRSLADFARIVAIFDAAECSFVSVIQSFNTTGSMGKLMLNVLLSFAQFEREVTGERIRDKIAASKAKGMWMGGNPPLGYDKPEDDRRILRVNEVEAKIVRDMFTQYLGLGSVHALQLSLAERGICSKRWITEKGRIMGAKAFSRGALFHLLRNQLYLGQIVHKDQVHEGGHAAIVHQDLFDQVQQHLDGNARRHRAKAGRRKVVAPLMGKLFDAAGEPMSPTTSRGKSGKRYRYYVSASLQQRTRPADETSLQRLSALEIERVVGEAIQRWVPRASDPFAILRSVHMSARGLHVSIEAKDGGSIARALTGDETIADHTADYTTVLLPVALPMRGGKRLVVPSVQRRTQPDPILVAALRKAHAMLDTERGMPMISTVPTSPYDRNILRLAFLAPDIQRALLEGRQPYHLNLETMKKIDFPLSWSRQRKVLGFSETENPCSAD